MSACIAFVPGRDKVEIRVGCECERFRKEGRVKRFLAFEERRLKDKYRYSALKRGEGPWGCEPGSRGGRDAPPVRARRWGLAEMTRRLMGSQGGRREVLRRAPSSGGIIARR